MPELPEVEAYRILAERNALGRVVAGLEAHDGWYLKRATDPDRLAAVLVGQVFVRARRRGKLLLLDVGRPDPDDATDTEGQVDAVLGLRFGMTGRLLVDGEAGVGELLYSARTEHVRFERFAVNFGDGGRLVMSDPRRLGGVDLDPDENRLGPDALTVTLAQLRTALAGSAVSLKARIMDQTRLAGVGNLIADEILWRAALAPTRPAGELAPRELRRLQSHLTGGIAELIRRGGAHTGDLMPERHAGGVCPRDGTPLLHATVGGRSTWWCPKHQH